jgi:hypothetical protein
MNFIPIGRILLRDVYIRIAQNNTPTIATVGFIVVVVVVVVITTTQHVSVYMDHLQVSTIY